MIYGFTINSYDLVSQYAMTSQDVENIVDYVTKEITAKFASFWEDEAKHSLHATRERYMKSLYVLDEGRMKGAVVLSYNDKVVQMIEEGIGAFDIKEGFAHSPKRKEKKDGGWYLTIPFKIGAPNTIGDSGVFGMVLPMPIYEVVKNKDLEVNGRSKGLTEAEIKSAGDNFALPKSRAAVSAIPTSKTFEEYKHKTSLFQGVIKVKDSVTKQNTYMSFRRVSDKSDPNSFIHSGINAYNLAEKALSRLDSVIEPEMTRAIDNALAQYGF